MVALTGTTEVKMDEDLKSATVVEEHSCDNTSEPDLQVIRPTQPYTFSFYSCQNNTSEATFSPPPHTHTHLPHQKQVGDCLSAGLQWVGEEVMQQRN